MRKSFPVLLLVLIALATGALMAGCGGGEDNPGATGSAEAAGSDGQDGAGESTSPAGSGEGELDSGSAQGESSGSAQGDTAFAEQANAICDRGREEGREAVSAYVQEQKVGAEPRTLLAEGVRSAVLPKIRQQIQEIRALEAPSDQAAQIKAFLKAMEDGVAASADRSKKVLALRANFLPSAKLAQRLAIESCIYTKL